ncbi:hypothetical protein [Zavarzinella formosa]|uniref:hypothetical protein n=1 Tax=Zavarzinella formosa TaxID=360055 RepID=UPI0002F21D5F|nr:hypothetical protein [Zavarzinella formosa]
MAKSSGVQDFLIEKGEKVGLGIAGGIGGLLLILGVMSIFGREQNPEEFAKQIDTKASSLTSQINSPNGAAIEPVSPELIKPVTNNQVALQPLSQVLFDPNAPPDGRRLAPVVLRIAEGDAKIAVVKIPASDIFIDKEGEKTKIRVGVITTKDTKQKVDGAGKFLNQLKSKLGAAGKNIRLPPANPYGMPGMQGPGGMGGFPGGPGGMGGFPGGPGGPGMSEGNRGGGFPGGMGGGFPGGMGGGFPGGPGGPGMMAGGPGGPGMPGGMGMPGGAMSSTPAVRHSVEYIDGETDEELETKMKGRRMAITIAPERMAVLQASFPYRAQLERYRQALQYQTLDQLYARPDEMPVFNGVEVQRRISRPNGTPVEDWTPLPFVENSQQLRAVKLLDKEDPQDMAWVTLHEDNQLVMPLPTEVTGKYPDMNLKTIKDSIKKLKDANTRPNLPAPPSRFSGNAVNPFSRSSVGGTTGASFYNPGAGPGGGEPGSGSGFMLPTKGPGKGPMMDMGPGGNPNGTASGKIEPPDYIYIRVFDTEVKDGLVYNYRMRAKLVNPNFGKRDLVSKSSDADNKELPLGEEHWFEFPESVTIPNAIYQYVIDSPAPAAGQPTPPGKGQAIIQIHRFEQRMEISRDDFEPVGDWVIGELVATKGLYVQGEAWAKLPLWSSITNDFELRTLPGEKTTVIKGPPRKVIEARKGVLFRPIPDRKVIAVDIVGGQQLKEKIPNNPTEKTTRSNPVTDESGIEVLLMYPDGSLELKSSAIDKADPARRTRDANFKKWYEDTRNKENANPGGPAMKTPDV